MLTEPVVRVLEVFDSLQGEGAWAGVPMTFVRLAGCNAPDAGLACVRWCDTPESWDASAGDDIPVSLLAGRLTLPRVCLTGGEPLLQQDGLAWLVPTLQATGRRVHLESNGTLDLPAGVRPDWLTVSPKPPGYDVAPELRPHVQELKVVVDRAFGDSAVVRLEALAALSPEAVVCLQPEASGGEVTLRRALELVMSHPEWRLSLQIHKLLGVR